MARETERLRIEGHVQGVGYRAWTARTARELGLSGWVRNRRDGSVEVLAIGEAAALETLARLCRQGPPHARVDKLDRAPAQAEDLQGFEQRETM